MRALRAYVTAVDRLNYGIGRAVMFGIFALMGVLLWSTVSKVLFTPSLWTLEMAQFLMVGYYVLGGPYAMQMGADVRMDLIYGELGPRRKAWTDAFTIFVLLAYLGVLLWGGIESTLYSLDYGGERSSSAWRPYLWPVKVAICAGLVLMMLQALAEFGRDVIFLSTGERLRHPGREARHAL